MEKGKKKFGFLYRLLFVFFIMFLCLYSISSNGYLEKINENKTLFTDEQIRRFEEDVENGEYIDINDYILPDQVDYSNSSSELGENISSAIEYTANKSIEVFNSFFAFLFN